MDDLKMIRVQIADHNAAVTMDQSPLNAWTAQFAIGTSIERRKPVLKGLRVL